MEELFLIALVIDAKFQGKMTRAFKSNMRNLANFHQSILRGLKIGILMGYFYSKQKIYELKIYWGVFCHDNEV